MTYTPAPIDTDEIGIDDALLWIAEKMAENNHDVWARQRLEEGWDFGRYRNDHLKQTPCLVPYDDLQESEKEYDRNSAIETLKVILKLGFHITAPAHQTAVFDNHNGRKQKSIDGTGSVMVFSGHMIDQPARKEPRFPPELENIVRERIRVQITKYNGKIGYAAAASGSDILFLEEMDRLGGEINIILPVPVAEFKQQSVADVGGDWLSRFERLLDRADRLQVLDQYSKPSFVNILEFCNFYMFGLARLRAKQENVRLYPLAVFDGLESDERMGGTASTIRIWQDHHAPYSWVSLAPKRNGEIIETEENQEKVGPRHQPLPLNRPLPIPEHDGTEHHLCLSVLFISRQDSEICYSTSFLDAISRIAEPSPDHLLSKLNRNEGLLLVFNDLDATIETARQILEEKHEHEQGDIFLDAGPCFSYFNSVTKQLEFCGRYIERATTIKPPPMHDNGTGIRASESFAAACMAADIKDVQFSPAGEAAVSGQNTIARIYHVNC